MAVTMAEITKLRHLTSAGLMDCKKPLPKLTAILRPLWRSFVKGQAVAAKREDREASEGCVLARTTELSLRLSL